MRYSHMTVMRRCDWFFPFSGLKFPLLTHLRDSNVVQFQQSLFTAKVSYHTVIGYSATTIFDKVTEAGNNEKRIKKTETAKQSTLCMAPIYFVFQVCSPGLSTKRT